MPIFSMPTHRRWQRGGGVKTPWTIPAEAIVLLLIAARGMPLAALAKASSMSPQTVTAIVRGDRHTTPEEAQAIVAALFGWAS